MVRGNFKLRQIMEPIDFSVREICEPTIPNPIEIPHNKSFLNRSDCIAYDPNINSLEKDFKATGRPLCFELAGPRAKLAFEPETTRIALTTCGGLCPGINTVVRSIVLQAWTRYGVKNIVGARFGYHGLGKDRENFVKLTPEVVSKIQTQGGTILGTSRGTPPPSEIVDTLVESKINILFAIGGDGTMRGVNAISEEISKRNLKIAVVGVPKTIDNDIPYVRRSFGFDTASSIASVAINAAHTEALAFDRCVGLVRLMGRHSGYIAASAALASGHVNLCLVPEVPFKLEGKGGFLDFVEKRLSKHRRAVIVVAEGAGQHLFNHLEGMTDPSGNRKLGNIGELLKERMLDYFELKNDPVAIKYIDPSYTIRSATANPSDQLFCSRFAQNAVHAAMSGKTAMMIGYWHGRMTHVPVRALTGQSQRINPQGDLWFNVLETTGQPINLC